MLTFGPKPWVNPFGKISIFRLIELLVFIAQKGVYSFQNIVKKHFPNLYCLKKKVGEMAIFGPKPWDNLFGKLSVFRLFKLLVFIAQKAFFSFQNIVKDIFVTYIKKKVGRISIFAQKPWVNSFGKISIFRLFELLVYIAQKGVFSI